MRNPFLKTFVFAAALAVLNCTAAGTLKDPAESAVLADLLVHHIEPIEKAVSALPREAFVFLKPLPPETDDWAPFKYEIGVAPKGMPPFWVGTAYYSEPCHNEFSLAGGTDPDCMALQWLSTTPPLLLLTTYDVPGGSSRCQSRQDYVLRYTASRPTVVLRNELEIFFRSGWDALYFGERKISSKQTPAGLELQFLDECTQESFGWESDPLQRRKDVENSVHFQDKLFPDGLKDRIVAGARWGGVTVRRTRVWLISGYKTKLRSNVLEYCIQPGDTLADISQALLSDVRRVRELRKLNGDGVHDPLTPNQWIRLPLKGTTGLTPANISGEAS